MKNRHFSRGVALVLAVSLVADPATAALSAVAPADCKPGPTRLSGSLFTDQAFILRVLGMQHILSEASPHIRPTFSGLLPNEGIGTFKIPGLDNGAQFHAWAKQELKENAEHLTTLSNRMSPTEKDGTTAIVLYTDQLKHDIPAFHYRRESDGMPIVVINTAIFNTEASQAQAEFQERREITHENSGHFQEPDASSLIHRIATAEMIERFGQASKLLASHRLLIPKIPTDQLRKMLQESRIDTLTKLFAYERRFRTALQKELSSRPKILVVDDDAHITRLWEVVLERNGYVVEKADSVENALKLGIGRFAAAVVDTHLISSHGGDLIDSLRASNPHFPVVICSGQTQLSQPILDRYPDIPLVAKPSPPNVLLAVLRKQIEEHATERRRHDRVNRKDFLPAGTEDRGAVQRTLNDLMGTFTQKGWTSWKDLFESAPYEILNTRFKLYIIHAAAQHGYVPHINRWVSAAALAAGDFIQRSDFLYPGETDGGDTQHAITRLINSLARAGKISWNDIFKLNRRALLKIYGLNAEAWKRIEAAAGKRGYTYDTTKYHWVPPSQTNSSIVAPADENDYPVNLVGVPDRDAVAEPAARFVYDTLQKNLQEKGRANLLLPADRTSRGMYQELVRLLEEHPLDLSNVHFFFLDNYYQIPAAYADQSFAAHAKRVLTDPLLDVQSRKPELGFNAEHVHTLNDQAESAAAEATAYEVLIKSLGGIDLAVLGMGENGHLAFREPGSHFESRTDLVKIAARTRVQNQEFFGNDPSLVPEWALTVGLGTILDARKILQLVSGPKKAVALQKALEGPISTELPSSVLRLHSDVTVIADAEARALLRSDRYSSTTTQGTATGGLIGFWFDRLIYQPLMKRGVPLSTIQTVLAPMVQGLFFQGVLIALPMVLTHGYFYQHPFDTGTSREESAGIATFFVGSVAVLLSGLIYGSRGVHPRVYKGSNAKPVPVTSADLRNLRERGWLEGATTWGWWAMAAIAVPGGAQLLAIFGSEGLRIPDNPLEAWMGSPLLLGVALVAGLISAIVTHAKTNATNRQTSDGVIGTATPGDFSLQDALWMDLMKFLSGTMPMLGSLSFDRAEDRQHVRAEMLQRPEAKESWSRGWSVVKGIEVRLGDPTDPVILSCDSATKDTLVFTASGYGRNGPQTVVLNVMQPHRDPQDFSVQLRVKALDGTDSVASLSFIGEASTNRFHMVTTALRTVPIIYISVKSLQQKAAGGSIRRPGTIIPFLLLLLLSRNLSAQSTPSGELSLTQATALHQQVLKDSYQETKEMIQSADAEQYYLVSIQLMGMLSAVEATQDSAEFQKALDEIDAMIAKVSTVNGHPAWKDASSGKPEDVYTLQTLQPIARAAAMIMTTPALKSKYAAKAKAYVRFVSSVLPGVDEGRLNLDASRYPDWLEHDPEDWGEGVKWNDKSWLLGDIATFLYQATRETPYKTLAEKIGRAFKARLTPAGKGWIWDKGQFIKDDRNTDKDWDTDHTNRVEMMLFMREAGIGPFTSDDVLRMSRTLTTTMWNGSTTNPLVSNYITGSNAPYSDHKKAGENGFIFSGWAMFGQVSSDVNRLTSAVLQAAQKNSGLNPTVSENWDSGYKQVALTGHYLRSLVKRKPGSKETLSSSSSTPNTRRVFPWLLPSVLLGSAIGAIALFFRTQRSKTSRNNTSLLKTAA